MMSVALVLFGLVALTRLPVRELPDIDPPLVNVLTVFPGANAEVVETSITEKLEEAINSIEGIKELTSESREQVSSITVEFDLSRDIDLAAQDVRDRVSRVRGELPDDIEEPIVAKQDADAQPVIWIALFSDRYSTLELTTLAENQIKDRLQTVKGVSSVYLGGRKRFAMRIRLDAEKMAARQLTVGDVEDALRTQNVELPSGRVESLDREMTIQTRGEMKTAEEFNDLVVKEGEGGFVRIRDIGRAEVGVEDERSIARFNSKPAVGIGIVKQSKANTIEVARGVKEELERIIPLLPVGVETSFPYDESIYVEQSIHEVWLTLGIAFALVVITIFVFLRNVRSTLIPCLTIPVAIVGTYFVLSLMGYSVNILTMLALVLAIGIVVDDSIVVLENIYRHIEDGMAPMDAAFRGMKEIGFAVIAVTLSLCAVFIPLAFQTSVTGRLFIEFAIALTGSVIISAFVALTLTPMVAARILKPVHAQAHGRVFNFFERAFDRLAARYKRRLTWALDHRRGVSVITLVLIVAAAWVYGQLDQDFLPDEDKGRLLAFTLTPEGSTSEYTDRMLQRAEAIVKNTPEVHSYFSAVALAMAGPGKANQALMFMRFHDERERGVHDIVGGPTGLGAQLFGNIEGALSFPIIPKAIGRGFSQPFQVVLKDPDLARLNTTAQAVAARLRTGGFLVNVRSTYEVNKPELRVKIDRNRAAALGVSVQEISRTLQILFGGLDLSKIKISGKEYQVIAQLDRQARQTPADLDRLYVRGAGGKLVQISNVVTYETGAGPSAINHFNRFRSATIEGTPMPGVVLGTVVEKVQEILRSEFPDARYDWTGEASDLQESGQGFLFVLVLALVIVYMVLASQFESLLHPLTIMLTVPLSMVGAVGLLWALNGVNTLGTGMHGWAHYAPNPPAIAGWLSAIIPRIPAMNINLFSQIGMVLLTGLATKNSILLVEFANQQMAQGKTAREAMLQAGMIRFRPILMTSFSTILGILPIAIGFGAGGESRRPLGVAAVGGMLVGTFLTLLIVPVVYTLFADMAARRAKGSGRRAHGGAVVAVVLLGVLALAGVARAGEEERLAGGSPSSGSDAGRISDEGRASREPSGAATNVTASYDLRRCIGTALENSYEIRKARERIQRQDGAVVEARAQFVPTVAASGNFQSQGDALAGNFGGPAGGDFPISTETWRIGLEVTQPLYAGGGNAAELKRNRLLGEAAAHDLTAVINDVLLDVRERYFAVLLARSQVTVQEQSVQLLEEELSSAQNKLEAGMVSPFNVLRAEVALANGQTPLIRARNDYRLAIEDLCRAMGLSAGDKTAGDETASRSSALPGDGGKGEPVQRLDVQGELAVEEYQPDLQAELAAAMAHRPELQRLAALRAAQRQTLTEARAGHRPDVSLFAGYGYENEQATEDTWDYVDGWRAGVQGSWALFDGRATRGRLMQAASGAELARLDEEQARLDIDVEVRRAHAQLLAVTELVHATSKVVEQALESVRLARSRFDAGAATQLDVLQTQVALTQARDNAVQAQHDYAVALAQLRKATGQQDQFVVEAGGK